MFFPLQPLGPPRVSERVNHRQSARLGRTVKLSCPVESDPPPLIMWTKDGRNIHSGWTRFKVLQAALRIKEVETDDAGTYICKATNGFGSVNVNYTLIVIGRCTKNYLKSIFGTQYACSKSVTFFFAKCMNKIAMTRCKQMNLFMWLLCMEKLQSRT